MPRYYYLNRTFSSLQFMDLPDKELLTFIRLNDFSPNAAWARDNPCLHYLLANELFSYAERLFSLIPNRIDPNLCDGPFFGKKSLLILLVLLTSSGDLTTRFIKYYKDKLDFDYQDIQGKTALHYAFILGRADVVSLLIELGASVEIEDKEGNIPFDYLDCPAPLIYSTLKMVDIEPYRDINALSNYLKDHYNRPIMLQGTYIMQRKEYIANILKDKTLFLVKYIEGNLRGWSTFTGDDAEETKEAMLSLAKDIAQSNKVPLNKIFVNTYLSREEQNLFSNKLERLSITFCGKCVLAQCMEGHEQIRLMIEEQKMPSKSSSPQ